MRVFLGLFIVLSLGIFAANMMKYNEIKEETAKLESVLTALEEKQKKLEIEVGSAEKLQEILSNYQLYREMFETSSASSEEWEAYETTLQELREMLNESPYRETLVRIAKEKLNLYFPDEKIIYNDRKQ